VANQLQKEIHIFSAPIIFFTLVQMIKKKMQSKNMTLNANKMRRVVHGIRPPHFIFFILRQCAEKK